MKKLILCALITFCSMSVFAQEDTNEVDQNPKHEAKLNALYLILGTFDVTYEHLLNEESGVGLEVFLPIDNDVKDDINFYVSPYYRLYFGKKYAAGFFLEGFGMLNSTNEVTRSGFFGGGDVISVNDKNIIDFALGIGLGGKWVTNNGFVGEINLGFGRNLFNSSDDELVGKAGITIGYRF